MNAIPPPSDPNPKIISKPYFLKINCGEDDKFPFKPENFQPSRCAPIRLNHVYPFEKK